MEDANQPNSGNEPTSTQNDGVKKVEMSQEDFDALINKKYAKGAESAKAKMFESLGVQDEESLKAIIQKQKELEESQKTEMQKNTEAMEALKAENEKLMKERDANKAQATVNAMAVKHGIKDVDYFSYELKKANVGEDFNEDEFIKNLKESKPYVFGQKPNTDFSSNKENQGTSLKDKVAGKSFKELRELQKNL